MMHGQPKKKKVEINFIYLGNKKTYYIFKTRFIISVLFSTRSHSFNDLVFLFSNNTYVFHKPCAEI
jgi:hypothetical protein